MTKTILVIEDEKVTRNNLLEFLQSEKFQVIEAENGSQGIHLANTHLPDLIICDIMMPEMDGYDVLFHLQQHSTTKTIPFIFLTVTNEEEFLAKSELLRQDDYLQKPITSKNLIAAINSKLNKSIATMTEPSLQEELGKVKYELQKLEGYSNSKDILLKHLCEDLKEYLSPLNKEINELKNNNSLTNQHDTIDQIQQKIIAISTIINQVATLQNMINIDNYQILDEFIDLN